MTAALPIPPDPAARDAKHLQLLAVFHFVNAALSLASAALLVVYIVFLGSAPDLVRAVAANQGGLPDGFPEQGLDLAVRLLRTIFAFALVFSVAKITLDTIAGFDMLKRRRRTLSLFAAGINCLSVPLGTTLGIFTFIVLSRDSVRALYQPNPTTDKP